MKKISVATNDFKYDILIENGLLKDVFKHITFKNKNLCKYILITDQMVERLYINVLKEQCPTLHIITIEPGETSKSLRTVEFVVSELAKLEATRKDLIIAFGGGVVGDLAGFVASTYMRGIDYIHIPTTLLSQVDSSVGGKVAVNFLEYKNLIGSFYQPKLVLIDPLLLKTLPKRQLKNGMAEIIKIFLIKDKFSFYRLKNDRAYEHLEDYICKAIQLKRDLVVADVYEHHVRTLLNYGHTFGHALESYFEYKKYLHGEAVAIGMYQMAKDMPEIQQELEVVYKIYDLDYDFPNVNHEQFISLIRKDKKGTTQQQIKIVLLHEIGSAYTKEISYHELEQFL